MGQPLPGKVYVVEELGTASGKAPGRTSNIFQHIRPFKLTKFIL